MDFLVLTDIHHSWNHLEKMISLASAVDGVIFLGDLLIHGSDRDVVSVAISNFSKIYEAARYTVAVPGNGAIPEVIEYLDKLGISVHGQSRLLDDIGFFGVGGTPDTVALVVELRTFFQSEKRPAIELPSKALETLAVFGVSIRDGIFVVDDWSEMQVNLLNRFKGPFDFTEKEMHDILVQGYQSLSDCPIRILVSHSPPYEPILNPKFPEGVSTGSRGITKFVKEYQPSTVLSGHYHIFHKFKIGPVPCFIFPAVVDGFYSILNIDQSAKEYKIAVKTF